jgi:hypothetical protein
LADASSSAKALTAFLLKDIIFVALNATPTLLAKFFNCLSNTLTSCLAFLSALPFQVAVGCYKYIGHYATFLI